MTHEVYPILEAENDVVDEICVPAVDGFVQCFGALPQSRIMRDSRTTTTEMFSTTIIVRQVDGRCAPK